ncbi:MAG: ankyrin repeat domain-containing protein [Planctomycetota bacterium]
MTVQDVLDRSLAWAVQNAEYEVADDLLKRGADINTRWSTHEPASILHECAAAGRFEQVRYLVARGIDLSLRDHRFDATAEGWARHSGHEEIADFLTDAAA